MDVGENTTFIRESIEQNNDSTTQNLTVVILEFFQCVAGNLLETGIDCSVTNPKICVKCEIRGAYLIETSTDNDTSKTGYKVCQAILIACVALGIIGTFANAAIILVIYQRRTKRAVDLLLLNLAVLEFLCCFGSIFGFTAALIYFGKVYGSGKLLLYWIYIPSLIVQLCRSASLHLTVLITLERFLVITYPIPSRFWFSRTKSKFHVILILTYDMILCVPRYTSLYVAENIYGDQEGGLNVPSLAELDYIFRPTELHTFWLEWIGESFDYYLYLIDFCVTNTTLLAFNMMSVYKIRRVSRKRLNLNCNQQQEILVARMFTPVVVIVLFCSVWTFITFISTYATKIFYREIWTMLMLIYQVNSSANIFIYYFRSLEFRLEMKSLSCFKGLV